MVDTFMNTAQRVQDLIDLFISTDLFKKQVTVARELLRNCGGNTEKSPSWFHPSMLILRTFMRQASNLYIY